MLSGICSDCEKKAEYVLPVLNKTDYAYSEKKQSCKELVAGEEIYSIVVDGQSFEFKVTLPIYHTLNGKKIYNDGTIKSINDYTGIEVYDGAAITCAEEGMRGFYTCDECGKHYDIYVRKDHVRPADEKEITVKFDSCNDPQKYYYDCPNCNDDVTNSNILSKLTMPKRIHGKLSVFAKTKLTAQNAANTMTFWQLPIVSWLLKKQRPAQKEPFVLTNIKALNALITKPKLLITDM